ncbi:Ger(x)C family spore germination protein [Paenibacillus protaetiae]|uniref:Ger(X)C family spore germination protein n=1 Tax=Paenibacillus protaetiae TaxID=2509456 RepID=A0A4P6ES09_9BACL|nr:Ger(x)C family spore germination protein [Paenibacillus protaetiae]QAY65870.1 Ger(x)C family spore germination protein [Paenibacillus protaetiae]
MKKTAVLLIAVMMSVLLSSCWSEIEVNEIAIVTASGLDLTEEGKIRLSLLLAIPRLFGTGSAQGGGESKLVSSAGWVVSQEGDTIMDITRALQKKLPRQITYSHSRVLIIGNSLAKSGVTRVIDFFERYRQAQLISYIAVSETSALDILNFKPKYEKLSSEVLKSEMAQNLIPSMRVIDFLNLVMSDGVEPYTPLVSITPSQQGGDDSNTNIAVKGIAVFKGEKMIGQLSDKDARGVLWVKNQIHKGIITIDIPNEPGKISAELERVHVKRHVTIEGGKVGITLVIRLNENIYENTSSIDLDSDEGEALIQKQVEEAVKLRIKESSAKVQQQFKSDIYGYGQSVYRRYPKAWNHVFKKQWEEMFPAIEPEIMVKGRIIRSGLTNEAIHPEE